MGVTTVIEKTTISATSALHYLSLHELKTIIYACKLESYNGLEQ